MGLEQAHAVAAHKPARFAPAKIAVNQRSTLRLFAVADITRFYTVHGTTRFRSGGVELEVELSLDTLEARLQHLGFQRAHRGELINLSCVTELARSSGSGGTVRLSDGQIATVSKRHYPAFFASLNLLVA